MQQWVTQPHKQQQALPITVTHKSHFYFCTKFGRNSSLGSQVQLCFLSHISQWLFFICPPLHPLQISHRSLGRHKPTTASTRAEKHPPLKTSVYPILPYNCRGHTLHYPLFAMLLFSPNTHIFEVEIHYDWRCWIWSLKLQYSSSFYHKDRSACFFAACITAIHLETHITVQTSWSVTPQWEVPSRGGKKNLKKNQYPFNRRGRYLGHLNSSLHTQGWFQGIFLNNRKLCLGKDCNPVY